MRSLVLWLSSLVALWLGVASAAQQNRVEGALDFDYQVCYGPGNCQWERAGLVIGYSWRGCTDQTNCFSIPGPDAYESWGIRHNGGQLTFNFKPTNGAGLSVVTGDGSDQYLMFYLLNKELSFDVDLSTVGCGLNAALYFTSTPADGGKDKYGFTGPTYGTGYCDAQVDPSRATCAEMDIWEANSLSTVYTTHACVSEGVCNGGGCGFNAYGLGEHNHYGRGDWNQVDTTRPFTIVTQFISSTGTDDGTLQDIQRYYIQDGLRIENPTVDGFSSVTDGFCTYHGASDAYSVSGMTQPLKEGMVLTMSLWGEDSDDSMTWLNHPPNGPCPDYRNPDAYVTFNNLKIGPIGSTN